MDVHRVGTKEYYSIEFRLAAVLGKEDLGRLFSKAFEVVDQGKVEDSFYVTGWRVNLCVYDYANGRKRVYLS